MNGKPQSLGEHLQRIQGMKKRMHHPLLHEVHRKYRISRKTLFYIKEYGPHTHVAQTIIRESLKILILTSILSSVGGLALEHIKILFVSLVPLTILLPTLNDMIGDYGTIVSSRFSAMIHEGLIKDRPFRNLEVKKLIAQIMIIALITTILSTSAAFVISGFSKFSLDFVVAMKIFGIAILDVIILIMILSITSILAGLYFFKKGEDPNNFLIPITTSVADFGNMIILTLLVIMLF